MTDRHAPAADTLRVGTRNVRDGGSSSTWCGSNALAGPDLTDAGRRALRDHLGLTDDSFVTDPRSWRRPDGSPSSPPPTRTPS